MWEVRKWIDKSVSSTVAEMRRYAGKSGGEKESWVVSGL